RAATSARRHRHRHRRGRGHPQLRLERLHELRKLQDGDPLDVLDHLLLRHFSHFGVSLSLLCAGAPPPAPVPSRLIAARPCLSRLSAKSAVLPQSTPRILSDVFLGALGVLGGQRFFTGPFRPSHPAGPAHRASSPTAPTRSSDRAAQRSTRSRFAPSAPAAR